MALRAPLEQRAGPTIEFLGWVDGDALAQLYAVAARWSFPAKKIFGIVAVHAPASGGPLLSVEAERWKG